MSGIRVMVFDPSTGIETGGEELLDTSAPNGGWIWADFEGVDAQLESRLLRERFGIDKLAIQDAQRERHPPKYELFDKCLFLLLRELAAEQSGDGDPRFLHVAFFVGDGFLATRRPERSASIDPVWQTTTAEEAERGVSHTIYRICRQMVDHYTPLILAMEEKLAKLEDQMFENVSDAILAELVDYNRILKKLRRTFSYQHGIMKDIGVGEEGLLAQFDDHEFRDIYENMERLASLSQLNQELAVDLLNTSLSLASHKLNQIMRVLTIATVIFLPLGLLAGIYGMNFAWIPELGFRYGYFGVLGLMLTVVVTLVTVFRKRDWL